MKVPACFITICLSSVVSAAADDVQFFESRIRPVLVTHCYECHSSAAAEVQGGLLVDFREGLRHGGDNGAAVVPGDPDASLLMQALRHETLEMPPSGRLPDRVLEDFETWIRRGAADPRDESPSIVDAAESVWQAQLAERSRWWSLQPLQVVEPPVAAHSDGAREPIDRFVWNSLDQAGLTRAEPAGADVILRRLSLVLTGLPPRPELVQTFPGAFRENPDRAVKELCDDLLASPHFGERFARHWMDVVRYTDTYGYEWDNPARGSWEYRDYLIRAFNDDVPFDQMIREQIAGDLLDAPRISEENSVNESLIGPMFFHLGEHRHGSSLDFNGIHQEMVNNKIDAFSKTFQATTMACARCHDHKLDTVSQADYYALAGVFMSPRWTPRVIDAPNSHAHEVGCLQQLRGQIDAELKRIWKFRAATLGAAVQEWAADNASSVAEATIGDVAWPLSRILNASDDSIPDVWTKLTEEWKTVRASRIEFNRNRFSVVADFHEPGFPKGWTTEGDGILFGYVDHGTPRVSLDDGTLVAELLPRGYHTHALSTRLPGAVRLPPQQSIPGRYVSLQLAGGEWSGCLVAPENAFQSESVRFFGPEAPAENWLSIPDETLRNGVTRVFTDVATSDLNPNFPPRTDLARSGSVRLPENDFGFHKRSWFSFTRVVTHDEPGTPQDPLDHYTELFTSDPPVSRDEALSRIGDWFTAALNRWVAGQTHEGDVQRLNWLLRRGLLPNRPEDAPAIAALVEDYRRIESGIAFPRTVLSMDEREVQPIDYRINLRGNPDTEGSAIPRSYLSVFDGRNEVGASPSSGRFELAEFLISPDNPLTARVYVNRVWQWVFGRGLVGTPNDFGHLGDRPSHPELLDWLADRFMSEGWSTKQLVRRLVLSRTFRQAGTIRPEAARGDPDNRLLHHYPTRRMEAEEIRDSLLAVSGRLDQQLYGPPVPPLRKVEDRAKRLFSGPLDGHGRRSIYLQMSIMDPPKFLVCFNLPDLKLPTGRRDATNVPAQALALLNDPLLVELADHWAAELVNDGAASIEDRVRSMFVRAFGRQPVDRELRRWSTAVNDLAESDSVLTDKPAWAELAHALFNTKEFIWYR